LNRDGIRSDTIHGDRTQAAREDALRRFKLGETPVLVATDVAARGIDVEGLAFVIHHQLPDQIEYYTHRSGRTARAGKKGVSIVLIESKEQRRLKKIEEELGLTFTQL
jgi:ATP-dependent RNA helicase DeaD